MDRFSLMNAFATGTAVSLTDHNGHTVKGVIASIEREDGSGFCYNVHLYEHQASLFVRCVRP